MRKNTGYDVLYFSQNRKKPVSGSTKATSDFLAIVHEDYPTATISQLKEILSDRNRFALEPEAIRVLDDHIEAGYGDVTPDWKY